MRQGSDVVLVFAVVPTKVLAFGKGTFSHTRHDFRGWPLTRDDVSEVRHA